MKPTCIIVDDHEKLRNIICEWLQLTFPEIEFLKSMTGEDAIMMAKLNNPLAVVMDIGLPGMNGIEATRKIKELCPGTFIVIHTIYSDKAYQNDAFSAGADIYITKNRTQAELIPALQTLFKAARVNPSGNG